MIAVTMKSPRRSALFMYFIFCASMRPAASSMHSSFRGKAVQPSDKLCSTRELQNTVTFRLINTVTDTVISDIYQNSIISVGNLSLSILSIEAVVAPGIQHVSAKLTLSGAKSMTKVELPEYALCGNIGKDFTACNLIAGNYRMTADIYSAKSANGTKVATGYVDFQLSSPGAAPITAPLSKPTRTPTMKPNKSPTSCSIPKLVDDWVSWEKYPLIVAESTGAILGKDLVVISGFANSWEGVTTSVYSYDVTDSKAAWRKMDDIPVPGFHHAAYAVHGLVMYICGAYVGPDSVTFASPICFKYTHNAPTGKQWSRLPDLPAPRGGGGMNRIVETNSLVYATGATRPPTKDRSTTWELSLDNLSAGWIQRANIPYQANHISHVTASYGGKKRYYYLGGQKEQDEANGNVNDVVEWDQATKSWIRRKNMSFARGHASASTIAYGCGFIMIAGAINTGGPNTMRTDDISYYSIETDTWTSIGKLNNQINTPVCDIAYNVGGSDWIYCQTGSVYGHFSSKRKISL